MSLMRTPPWAWAVMGVISARTSIKAAVIRSILVTPNRWTGAESCPTGQCGQERNPVLRRNHARSKRPDLVDDPAEPALVGETRFGALALIKHVKIGDKLRLDRVIGADVDRSHHAADNQDARLVGDD